MLGTSIIRKEVLLCRGEGLGLHGPGGDPPRDDGRVQLDGPPVAHRGHIPPLVDEGDRGVLPRSWDPGVHSAGVIDG